MEIINELILQAVASPWLYPVMFAVAALDGFFPPVPSETVLVAAAAVAASAGGPDIVLLCATAGAGAVVGDNLAYLLGRTAGTRRWRWLQRPRVAAAFAWARATLERRGALLIIGARYIPVGRVAVNMSAGAVRYPWRRFLPLSIVASVSWTLYSAGIGLIAGHWLAGQPVMSACAGVIVALLIGLVVDRVAARRRSRTGGFVVDTQEERGKVSLS
ncbi:DedA family protein [Microbacterium jiangjiandongii]|uniref:DedA family protein n=1 Tax=Microbacterium jiangjiandongii TaxID=3049071 RepID=UPI00214A9AAD|nr:DedA family protein [Microbacterium sp. zg.Y843]MCR2814763.1 DedA family protein [Microbacterium sp. zg.Y843]